MTTFETLKSAEPVATRRLVAETARAFGWDAHGIAPWCGLLGCDPDEFRRIIQEDRLAVDRANGVHG